MFVAKQEHVSKEMTEPSYSKQQFYPIMIQEIKFNWPWVNWEVEFSGSFKLFCLENPPTKKTFLLTGINKDLSYWFHNVFPQILNLFLDIVQNEVSRDQLAANEKSKTLCILEKNK